MGGDGGRKKGEEDNTNFQALFFASPPFPRQRSGLAGFMALVFA
jgi:hypothetical protein